MESSTLSPSATMRAKIVAFVLSAGRWYTGGFALPVAAVAMWQLISWRIQQSQKKKEMEHVPRSALAAVRARKKTNNAEGAVDVDLDDDISKAPSISGRRRINSAAEDRDDQSVGSVYSQNRFSRPQKLRQRQRAPTTPTTAVDNDDAHSVGSLHAGRPNFIRASKVAHHDGDEVSVLSFSSNALHGRSNKTKKIPFSQHEEIVEFLNGKLEGSLEQQNKMRQILEVQNQELAKIAKAYEMEKRRSKTSGSNMDSAALHELYDQKAKLEIEQQKVQTLERSEREWKQALDDAHRKIQDLESSHVSMNESHNMNGVVEIQNQRIETLQETQNELDELLEQERAKVARYEQERAVTRRETMRLPWDESTAPKEEILVKKNMEINNLAQTSKHAQLRLIKSQKMWQLEKERAAAMEAELRHLTDQVESETKKARSMEQKHLALVSASLKSKSEVTKVEQAHAETKSYLKAETQKVLNLQKSYKQSMELLSKEQHRSSSLQSTASTFGETQIKVKSLQADLQQKIKIISTQKDQISKLEASLADERTNHSNKDNIVTAAATKSSHLQLTLGQARTKLTELEGLLQKKEKLYQQEKQRAADKENLYNVVKSSLEIEETKNNALEEERSELAKMLHEERSNNSNKQRALASHETSISSLETRFQKLEKDRSETQSMLDTERIKCRDLEYEIRALNDHIRTKESETEMVERRLQDTTSNLEFSNKKLRDAEEDREQMMRTQNAKIQNYMEEQNRLRNTKSSDQSRISTLEKSLMEKDLELDGERTKHGILTQDHGIVKRKLETEEEKNRSLELKQMEMKNELHDVERNTRLLETELDEKKKECSTEKNRCDELLVEQAKLKEARHLSQRKVVELESEKDRLSTLLETEKNRTVVFERLVEQKENNISMSHGQTEELYAQVATLEKELAERETLLKYDKETLDLLEHSLSETLKDLSLEKKKVSELGKAVEDVTTRLNEANDRQADELASLSMEHENAKLSISKMEAALIEKESEIVTLKNRVMHNKEMEATIAKQEVEMEKLRIMANESLALALKEEEIRDLKAVLEAEQMNLKDLEEKQKSLELVKAEKENDIAFLEASLKTKDSAITEKESSIENLQKSLSEEQNKVKTLTVEQNSSEVQQSDAQKQIRDLKSSLEKKETILSAKQDEINALEKTLDETKSEHTTLLKQKEAAIAVLQKAVKDDKTNFDTKHQGLIQEVHNSEERIQYLEQSLDDKLLMVAQLHQGVSVLEDELKETKDYYEHLVAPEEKRKMGMKLREMITATHQMNEITTKATAVEAVAQGREQVSRSGVSDLRNLLLATSLINGSNYGN